MKHFLTTTATVLVLATSAQADGHSSVFADMTFDEATNVNASDLIGKRVYASEADIENGIVPAGGAPEWDDIGEINEIVLSRSGDVQHVIIGVGGFLGLGEKDVAVDLTDVQFVSEDGENDYFLVVKANEVGVQDAPAYEYNQITNTMADDASDDTSMMAENRSMLTPPTVDVDGYEPVMAADLNTEDLTGARVYGANNVDIGEISELLISTDGKLTEAIIDVGGFLGLGEKPVAVTLEELTILRGEDGTDLRVYIDSTQEVLENQPTYEG